MLNAAGCAVCGAEVVCAPAFVHIAAAQAGLSPHYQVAAQNCWTGAGGAFTGEVR